MLQVPPIGCGDALSRERCVWFLALSFSLTFAAIRLAGMSWSGIPIPWDPLTLELVLLSLACLLFGSYYLWVRREHGLAAPLLGLGMVLAGSIETGEASDLAFYFGGDRPLADPMLSSADSVMGFCWRCYATWLDAHPYIYMIGDGAYRSIVIQAPLIVVALAVLKHPLRLCVFVVACQLAVAVTSLVAYGFPAMGPYTQYGMTAVDHPHITLMFSDDMRGTIAWLRAGDFAVFPDGLVTGLISFPSFHAAMAIAYMWAAWPTLCRWPAVALNIAMVAVTPIDGSHYLVDVLAGFGVGLLSITAATAMLASPGRLMPRPGRSRQAAPAPLHATADTAHSVKIRGPEHTTAAAPIRLRSTVMAGGRCRD